MRAFQRKGMRQGFAVLSLLAMLMSLLPSLVAAAPIGGASSAVAAQASRGSITLNVRECAATTGTWDEAQARSNDDLAAACTQPLAGVTANLTDLSDNQVTSIASGPDGSIAYPDLASGSYSLYTDIPRGTAWEVVYCTADGGNPYQKEFDADIVTYFRDLQAEQIVCTWYVIPVESDASTPTTALSPTDVAIETATPESTSTTAERPATGVITVDTFSCPSDAGLNGQSSFSDLDAACTASVPDITLHFSNQDDGVDDPRGTGSGGMVTWDNLTPAAYDLYSDIPREFANEVLYCSNLAGDISAVPFNDNVVATLNLAEGERFDCSWFVIPEDLKGETATPPATATAAPVESPTAAPTDTVVDGAATGTSLTVHLGICPTDYQGSDHYNDCHANGEANMEFMLDGPDGLLSGTTTLPETPGPGVVTFDGLSGGDYSLYGGPPGDFGHVVIYCSTQPDGTRIDAPIDGVQASLTIDADTNVLCDWYYIPEDARGDTPTPTQAATSTPTTAPTATATPTQAAKAEVLVTLYQCPAPAAGDTYGGATYEELVAACTQMVDDVPFTLRDADAAPLTANTGVSGPGAVRFYDLLPADYTLAPSLPDALTSTAVFCTINGENRYQKALQNGSVTFVDVESEQLACSWFAVSAPQPTPTTPTTAPTTEPSQPTATAAPTQAVGPTGSITVREYLCEKDKSAIKDWERECTPGSSGQTFRLQNAQLGVDTTGKTEASTGVLTFARLQNGHYDLTEETGAWCRATADRVDSESRVIVADGANTDVVIYQCNATKSLPSTGTGTQISASDRNAVVTLAVLAMVVLSGALALVSITTFVRTERQRRQAPEVRESANKPVPTASGRMRMRFR